MTFCATLCATLCKRLALSSLILFCVLTPMFPQSSFAQNNAPPPASVENRRQQLLSLFDEQWQYVLRTNPEWATMLGDNRYNDRLIDQSPGTFPVGHVIGVRDRLAAASLDLIRDLLGGRDVAP